MQNEMNYCSKIVSEMKNFAYELANFQNQFQYVSVTTSDYLKNKYQEAFNVCSVVKKLDLAKSFCKANGIDEKMFEEFLYNFEHAGDIIDEHNRKNLAKMPENRTNLVSVCGKDIVKLVADACIDISYQYLYGSTMLVNVLKGNKPKGLVDSGFEKSVYYGALKDIKTADIWEILEILIENGVINKTEGMYPVLSVNTDYDIGKMKQSSLHEIEKIVSRNFKKESKKREKLEDSEQTINHDGFDVVVNNFGEVETDLDLLSSLRDLRNQIANKKNISAYMVCTNKVLVRLATIKPKNQEEFLAIKGIGNSWYFKYGEVFSNAINKK